MNVAFVGWTPRSNVRTQALRTAHQFQNGFLEVCIGMSYLRTASLGALAKTWNMEDKSDLVLTSAESLASDFREHW